MCSTTLNVHAFNKDLKRSYVCGILMKVEDFKRSYVQQSSPGQTEGLKGWFKEWVDGWMGGFKEWVDGRVAGWVVYDIYEVKKKMG